jgi:hypothetical protein
LSLRFLLRAWIWIFDGGRRGDGALGRFAGFGLGDKGRRVLDPLAKLAEHAGVSEESVLQFLETGRNVFRHETQHVDGSGGISEHLLKFLRGPGFQGVKSGLPAFLVRA